MASAGTPAPNVATQSGRLSGFGFGKQSAQGTQASNSNRINSTQFDSMENYNPVYFETLNGQLDSEVETRIGIFEITGTVSFPAYSAQGMPFIKGCIGTAVNGASDYTLVGTVSGTLPIGSVNTTLSSAFPTVATAGYTGAPDLLGAWLTYNNGGANQEDVVVLGVNGSVINHQKTKLAHSNGESVTLKRAVAFVPNSGNNAANLDYFSTWMQWAKLFEEQRIDWQVSDIKLALGNEKMDWTCQLITSTPIQAEVAAFPGAAPTPTTATATSGGTVLAGTYQVEITIVTANGESLPSASASQITTGSTSTLTINSPQEFAGATGWYAYVTQAGGSVFKRQQTAGSPTAFGTNLVLTAPPTATGVDAATLTTSTATLSTLTYGTSENGDSPFISRDGGVYTPFNAQDTNLYTHARLMKLDYALTYAVQKDKVGGGEATTLIQTLASRKQTLTWSAMGGQQGPMNALRNDYARTGQTIPVILAFRNAKSGNCFSIVLRRCVVTKCDPVGPTDAPVAWDFEVKPLIDTTTGVAVSMWVRNGYYSY